MLLEAKTMRVDVITDSDKNMNHVVVSKCLAI